MSIKLGITGGIGSGKTIVSKLLNNMGVPVYISDIEAKRLTVSDANIRSQLTSLLGKDIYINNELNKPLLANYLFGNREHAHIINGIIHPQVKEDFRHWAKRLSAHPVIAMEAAILIEAGFANEVDKIVMVYAPLDIRVERAMKRDSANKEAVIQRIKSQMDDEEKRKMADYVIVNDNKTPLIPQILNLLKTLIIV
ncbi:dephospho-CoA kinase [Bacteroides sp. 519]|uniref:dephospho-CoA kinase n=1 Tax=Bacteroides sp. 519 TaxID=2302937 RepID=UPI0013D8669D|nr:dephospho-CoA kinase [Bacteroides sp. 519]NDV57099.1 dephospho-CoA kinase [Bacteroides sp. 519]